MLPSLEAHMYKCLVGIRPNASMELEEILEVHKRWKSTNSALASNASKS